MVTITDRIASEQRSFIVDTMVTTTQGIPSLTPRTHRQILKLLRSNNVALALEGSTLIGWLIATPYKQGVQELGMAFVVSEYRNQGILKRMIDFLIGKRPVTLAVTYEPKIAAMLTNHWQFQSSSLARFTYLTRTQFIAGRLYSLTSIKAVFSHMVSAKPIYLERISKHEK